MSGGWDWFCSWCFAHKAKHNARGGRLAVNDQMTLILIDWSHPMLRTRVCDTAQDTRVLSRPLCCTQSSKTQGTQIGLRDEEHWGQQQKREVFKCNLIFNEAILKLYGICYSETCCDCIILIIRVLKNCKAITNGRLKAMEFLLIRNALCTLGPFEMHLIANRKEGRERKPTMHGSEEFFSSALRERIQI